MKFIFGLCNWIKAHLMISIIVVATIGGITTIVIVNNNVSKEIKKTPDSVPQSIVLKENLNFEINSEVSLLSLISDNHDVEIISEDEMIDTSALGEKELVIKYLENNQEKEHAFKINIVDTTKPVIEFQNELSTTVGTKIDLLENVKVSDNSKEEIKATIDGEYNFDTVGTYNLKYVAVDASNNKTEEEFVLKVNQKQSSFNNTSTNNNHLNTNNGTTNNNSSNTGTTNNNTTSKPADPLKKYCDNHIAGYSNKSGICVNLYPNDECSYSGTCFGGDIPIWGEDYPGGREQYNIDLSNWEERTRQKAKSICAGRGYGWTGVFDDVFGHCTWQE